MKIQPSIIVELIHIYGPMKGVIQEFSDGYISIGRHPSCSVCFPSKDLVSVSRNHAEITREGNQFKLVDQSTNGTYLNGRKVTEAYLKDGDVLEFSEGGPKVSFITKVVDTPNTSLNSGAAHDDPEVIREEIVPDKPVQVEPPQPVRVRETTPPQVFSQYSPSIPLSPQQPISIPPYELPTGKVTASLVIQFGPSLRTYRELPVTIGSNPACEFVITYPTILGRHAQIIYARDQYWIKDLTGQGKIRVNNSPISFQASLNVNDVISLAPQGPALCFLGEGRFAEAAESVEVSPLEPVFMNNNVQKNSETENEDTEGLWAKLKKRF